MARGSDVLLVIVAIIFPPAAAAFITGCSCDLLINLLLTILVSRAGAGGVVERELESGLYKVGLSGEIPHSARMRCVAAVGVAPRIPRS